ncbi:hypothetical protein H696_02662 [Fonticula alba]|uniref:Peptidase M20 dimerisation domain-containing protein n=1 Tax=Fonticula alba TaxID=691883 RepID=A0A058Z7T0_FONAL|nr:hypothetical protein H696_02662 [Fonticula alba]KCV70335.1 hypothetical protein H696_02662 [Fonticula alba]|eukprot:XP_009494851.1 hypothetical protein H696_02662 [Fonticula alba]
MRAPFLLLLALLAALLAAASGLDLHRLSQPVAGQAFNDADTVDTLREMVRIESISGNELRMSQWLADRLMGAGWDVEQQQVEPSRYNVLAYHPANRHRLKALFSSHIDTVPPFLPFSENAETMFGRGTADAKGSVSAMIHAAESLNSTIAAVEGVIDPTQLGLLFVVGEEVNHIGMRHANELNLHSVEHFVSGEPTESLLAVGHKGMWKFRLEIFGRAAHSGYPHLGESAISPMLDLLRELNTMALPVSDLLGPTTLNIGILGGGVAANVVPDYASAEIMVRVSTNLAEVKTLIERVVRDRATITDLSENEPFICDTIPGFNTTIVAYNTDLPFFEGDHKSYLLGPGSITVAHTDDEQISKRELVDAVGLFRRMAVHMLAQ